MGSTWSEPSDVSSMLGPTFSPNGACGAARPFCLAVGPGHGIQLSSTNPHHPNRLIFAGHHGAYQYDQIWYSDDGGKTYTLSRNASLQGDIDQPDEPKVNASCLLPPAPPYYNFPRGKFHTRGNIWSFTVG